MPAVTCPEHSPFPNPWAYDTEPIGHASKLTDVRMLPVKKPEIGLEVDSEEMTMVFLDTLVVQVSK